MLNLNARRQAARAQPFLHGHLRDDQRRLAPDFHPPLQDIAPHRNNVGLILELRRRRGRAQNLPNAGVWRHCHAHIRDDFDLRMMDAKQPHIGQRRVHDQRRQLGELRANGLDAAPRNHALAVRLRERQPTAHRDGGIGEEIAHGRPDADELAPVTDRVERLA